MYCIYNIYFITALAVVGGSLFGFDIASMSAFLSTQPYLNYFNSPGSTLQGFITASMALGSFFASLASGFFADRFGRKTSIQGAAIIWIIGSAVQAGAPNVGGLIAGRIISGLAIGQCSSQVPVYLAEMAPKNLRGRLVGCQQWSITWGIMIMFYISFGCTFLNDQRSFKLAWALQMVPGFVLFIGLFFLPESPRWLAARERNDEVMEILANVHAHGNHSDPVVLAELKEIQEAVRIDEAGQRMGLRAMFKKRLFKRTFIGLTAQMWQQLTGMNVMMYYISYVFLMAGLTANTNLISSSIQYVINVVMTVPGLYFLDRWGRRPMLIIGALLMATCMFIVGGVLASYGTPESEVGGNDNIRYSISGPPSKVVIAFTYLFVASFAPTWGPGIWVYVSEIFPLEARAYGNGISAACNWAFNFALAFFVPPAFTNITYKTYFIFATFNMVAGIQVFFMFPETQGKSLEEINLIFETNIPAYRTHRQPSKLEEDARAIAEAGGFDLEKGSNAKHNEDAPALNTKRSTDSGGRHSATTATEK